MDGTSIVWVGRLCGVMPNLLSSYTILLIGVEEVYEGSLCDEVEWGVHRFQESSTYVEVNVAQPERGTLTIWVGGFNVSTRSLTQEEETDYRHVSIREFKSVVRSSGNLVHLSNQ
jgi:hypothetical protein